MKVSQVALGHVLWGMGLRLPHLLAGLGALTSIVALCTLTNMKQVVHSLVGSPAKNLEEILPNAEKRLRPYFTAKNVAFPPTSITLTFIKNQKRLEMYSRDGDDPPVFIHSYPVLAASGKLGPKLKEGDGQVPEGIYRVSALNPKSRFHLSLRLDYPNAIDRRRARAEARTDLGGDIMIHGGAVSVGCIAIGDTAIEEIFALAKLVPFQKWKVILSPIDFRRQNLTWEIRNLTAWTPALYEQISRELKTLPVID